MTERVMVFIDVQNAHRHARAAIFSERSPYRNGQFHPVPLGSLLAERGAGEVERALHEVRVYTGRPDARKEARSSAAHMKQCAAWAAAGVTVVARPLQYLNWPTERPREKGVDVQLAIDVVRLGIEGEYDAAILFSSDTDLVPAVEFVASRFHGRPRIETAAWKGRPGIRNAGVHRIWCHFLDRSDYDLVHDPQDYTS